MYSILDKYGNKRCDVNSLEYRGEFMSVSSVVVTIKSNKPIEFANGDYIVFRGEEFTLRYTPAILKQARKDTYGEAFVYENMVFYAASDELTRCDFLDVVKSDNNIHYTSLPNFSFYAESVQELADRIQANLNRLYKGNKAWSVTVADGTTSKPHNFSCSNIKCWDALALANTELDLNFVIRGRNIIIGDTGSVIDNNFAYGKNLGLKSINSTTSENSAIITRLRAYGSTRNIPYRYYNKLYINNSGVVKYFKEKPTSGWELLISESMYMPNLMLPMFRNSSLIGTEGNLYNEDGLLCGKYRLGGTIGEDAYIESVDGIEKYGVNEGTVFFDTKDEENEDNIYPSMSGIIAQDLINAGYSIQLDSGDNGNLDEILSAEVMTDDGYLPENGSSINPSSFSVTLKDIGFDIEDYLLSGESAQIYFSSGELVGRTFEITSITKNGKKQILRLNRYLDEDIQWVFPNKYYNAKAGDKFVLLNIYMPDVYVAAAEFRLLERAKFYLADNDHNTINYTPSIDNIFLARNPEIAENIKEGNIFTFYDDDLGIHKSITISSIIIKIGESLIPEYEVTLSEDKDATLVDRITTEVSDNIGKTMLSASNIVSLSRLQFDKRYLRKTTEDTAEGEITFEAGLTANGKGVVASKVVAPVGEIKQLTSDKITTDHIESADYLGDTSGFKLANVDGDSYLEVDKLSVRKKAIFTELDIKRLDHIGGATVTSPASCRIDKVGTYYRPTDMITSDGEVFAAADSEFMVLSIVEGGYKCYFRAEDGERTINNDWKIGDQAMCHAYNTTTPRYYWRLVIAVSTEIEDGYHWVALSSSDCDADSDEPMAEDVIACFGNRTDTDRQQVIITNSEGVNSPYIQQLKGINSYNITDANVVTQLSPSKNIIRGEQIELSTASGNKGVQDLANDALKSAKTYTDTAFGNAKDYTDTSIGSAKEYADGVLGSAKEYADGVLHDAKGYADGVGSSALTNAKTYADGVGSSTLNNAKTYADGVGTSTLNSAKTYADGVGDNAEANAKKYADGVGTSVTTSVKGYADGLFADSKNYTQEREEYLQSQITANANGIGLCATKTELKTVSDGVDTLATRVTEAEASIKVNADGITALAEKTEVDITNLGTRISQAEASIKVNADNIALKASKTDLESVKNSVGGLNTRLTTAESQISQNADAIALKASKTELTSVSNAVGGLTNRVAAAESQIAVNAEGIASTVERINAIVEDVSMDGFTNDTIQCYSAYDGLMMSYNDGTDRNFRCSINLGARKKGDVIRITNPDGIIAYILACDGDTAAAQALVTKHNVNTTDKTLLGVCLQASGDEYVSPITYTSSIEMVLEQDAPIVFIQIKDNYRGKWKNSTVTIISERYSAQSRIEQSADNIRLQVGNAGINLDNQNITLTANKTTINGDLAVSVVKCYYDEAKTQLRSAYNGNGDGTIVYYYPNGQVMRQDAFVTDTSGNVLGMRTTYYKADGSVAWVLSEGGIQTTLSDYWEAINGGKALAYTDSTTTMMDICKQYLGEAMRHFSSSQFSRFVSQSGNYKAYNGKVAKGLKSSETPDSVTLYSGVLVYSIELVEDGVRPTYQVAYEQVTTKPGQMSPIMTKRFNSLGEVN